MSKQGCGTCLYVFKPNEDVYVCRRNPPTTHVMMVPVQTIANPKPTLQPTFQPAFPRVDPNLDWCGEYQIKNQIVS